MSLGPWYGYNLKERDNTPSGDQKSSSLFGPEVRLDYEAVPGLLLMGEGAAFNTLGTSQNDGWGARFAGGPAYQADLGDVHPYVGVVGGYIFGKGVENAAIVGPEIGVKFDLSRQWNVYARAGYDYNVRNEFGQGIINGGVGAAYRF